MKRTVVILLSICAATHLWGQGRVSVGFYNVENLFDTVANPFRDDKSYTPAGEYGWNTARYRNKIANLARVLDDMALDVVGLAEVENRAVVEDLVRACGCDYAYLHLTSRDRRGLDLALLYKGDKFFPDPGPGNPHLVRSAYGREFLYVRGRLAGRRVDIVVCHLPSNLNSRAQRRAAMASLGGFVDSLSRHDPYAAPIVMGDFNASPSERVMRQTFGTGRSPMDGAALLFSPFHDLARRGMGTYVYGDRWRMFDNIAVGTALMGGGGFRYESCGIFIREYLLSEGAHLRRGYPLRTFVAGRYLEGYSDHLPLFITLTF